MFIRFEFGIISLRELLGASLELITMESQARKKMNKEVKKVLQMVGAMVEGASPILMDAPKESTILESHEEFYDAIMANDLDEEEDEHDENGLVNKHEACPLIVLSLH